MIISISGMPGSGKSSVGGLVAKRLGYKFYSAGKVRRMIAERKGMTLEEYNKLGETDPLTDKEIDDFVMKLGQTEDDFVIDSKLAFHFIPKSLKFFLKCDLKVAAERIFNDQSRKEEKFRSVKETEESLKRRIESDKWRYQKYYRLDAFDKKNYDYVIDTTKMTMGPIIEKIVGVVVKKTELQPKN